MPKSKPTFSPMANFWGAIVGVFIFVGINIAVGRPMLPDAAAPAAQVTYAPIAPLEDAAGAGEDGAPADPGKASYTAVCAACHQAEGQGMAGAFPPLAGSEWVTGDPETPIRIVLGGLGGEIEVAGTKWNSAMPPQGAALNDEQIAQVLTYARANFGNSAEPIDAAKVKQVRDSLAGRTNPWTAAELSALRGGGEAEPAAPAAE